MLSLSLFIGIWLLAVALFAVIAFFSIFQFLRFGLRHPFTIAAVIIFLIAAGAVILLTLGYLATTNLDGQIFNLQLITN